MARTVRDATLDTRAARNRLRARSAPFFRSIIPGQLHLGYRRRRPADPGRWLARFYLGLDQDGESRYRIADIGIADDFQDADGKMIFSFAQAQAVALAGHARPGAVSGTGEATAAAPTVRTVVEAYIASRDQREAKRNGRPIRSDASSRLGRYVIGREPVGARAAIRPAQLAAVPLHALTEADLQRWRSGLPAKLKNTTTRRTTNDLKAALTAGYEAHRRGLDPSLPSIIRHGLKLANGDDDEPEETARSNQILGDSAITKLLHAAREVDAEQNYDGDLFRMVTILAVTGARYSQIIRMKVSDCQIDRQRLLVPRSRKGKGKSGSERTPVPVEQSVIEALLPAVTGRASDQPLLQRWRHKQGKGRQWERSDRAAWPAAGMERPWALIREKAKMPDTIPYSLRHSSIVRGLRNGLPIRLVAALHDTSTTMIEKHYSAFITDGLEELARGKMARLMPPQDRTGKVVAMKSKR